MKKKVERRGHRASEGGRSWKMKEQEKENR